MVKLMLYLKKTFLTKEEQDWITEHPVISATNKMNWSPIDFVRDGKPVGFGIDYLNLVAQKTGLKIEYVNGLKWDELVDKVQKHEINISHSLVMTPEREKTLIGVCLKFAPPIITKTNSIS